MNRQGAKATGPLDAIPRALYYGVQPKPLLRKSLRKLEAARKSLREIAVLWDEVVNTVADEIDHCAMHALEDVEKALHDAVEYLNEPIDP